MTTRQNTVLIVEDDAPLRNALSEKLSRAGFITTTADNGETGLAALAKQLPDCVLLDVRMPKMDGMDMLKLLRQTAGCEHLPVVMLTNTSEIENVSEALTLGVQDYLVKSSWRLEEVVQKVKDKIAAS